MVMVPIFRTLLAILGVAISFGLLEFYLRSASTIDELVAGSVVDIQSPAILEQKLDAISAAPGVKLVVVGDSVPFGRSMLEHGNKDWRSHTLDRALERQLQVRTGRKDIHVFNLGMNGALPADVGVVAGAAIDHGADIILSDVTLRSFSSDFRNVEERFSRRWLSDFDKRLDPVSRYWRAFGLRDFFQWRLMNGSPRDALNNLLRISNNRLLGKETGDDPLLMLLAARQRYASISLDGGHPQLAAFEQMLVHADGADVPVVLFYATENPGQVQQIIDPQSRARLLDQLARVIDAAPGRVVYQPPIDDLAEERYLDQVHLDAEGYRQLGSLLVDQIIPLIEP